MIDRSAPQLLTFTELPVHRSGGVATRYVRTQRYLVAWSSVAGGDALEQDAERELFVILPDTGAELIAGDRRAVATARSICVVPAGTSRIVAHGPGTIVRMFAPIPSALAPLAANAEAYAREDPQVRPLGTPFQRTGAPGPRVYPLEPAGPERGRAPQSFQSETMSLGWFEYDGPDDPAVLYPHAHADFEEGSLMIAGDFVQHIDGADIRCGAGSLLVIPPQTMHSAEAIGPGRHILMNLFAPPREDHIAKAQIRNADEYAAPRHPERSRGTAPIAPS